MSDDERQTESSNSNNLELTAITPEMTREEVRTKLLNALEKSGLKIDRSSPSQET